MVKSMPGFIKPQLATLKVKAPSGDWLHEIQYDGYRTDSH
jgi:bifunctional non-homologous end joining protein LigD